MILEGIVMPIGTLNANKWGITQAEVPNVISTLKQSVVRLCSNSDHACDLHDSKRHEIGTVSDAWVSANSIFAKVSINDMAAESRIKSGELKAWSVYGQGDQQSDGFVFNYKNKSLTLVADPAWSQAQFKMIAASKSTRFMLTNSFKDDNMAPDIDEEKFIAGFDKKLEDSNKDLKKEFADLVASKDEQITALNEMITQQTEALKVLQASVEKLSTKDSTTKSDVTPEPKFASVDDLESLKSGIKTEKDIDNLVAAKLEQANEASKRSKSIEDYKIFAASRNLKLEDNYFDNKSSVMIESELHNLQSVSAAKSEPVYHSIPDEYRDDITQLTVGIPDEKGNWRV